MILSHGNIETIAAGVMKDFNAYCEAKEKRAISGPRFTPIDQFASDYLGLKVRFLYLSDNGNFCGLTAYADTEFQLEVDSAVLTIPLKQNEVILDSEFLEAGQTKKQYGKRRFELAHECAHQILEQLDSDQQKTACRKMYSERRLYSLRELKTREDWNDWQANSLGAAILMPWHEIEAAIVKYRIRTPLTSYGGYFNYIDRSALTTLSQFFGTSRSAMVIRLQQRGLMQILTASEYYDPLEVWP